MLTQQKKPGDHKWILTENLSPEIALSFYAEVD